jgi:Smg protein
MKETVLDVLMYIFDNYIEEDLEFAPDQDSLKMELVEAGFCDNQVDKAFSWLEALVPRKSDFYPYETSTDSSLRLFSEHELEMLDTECRGFLLFLEQLGVLNGNERELVLDRVMALESDEINLQKLKWVVLMVLFNQPDKQNAITWMEDIVMDNFNVNLH